MKIKKVLQPQVRVITLHVVWPILTTDTDLNNTLYYATFGKNVIPSNLTLVDYIDDMSDRRTIWRQHSTFFNS